jgi:quercetin dioxygenase-like cupin family protein
MKRMIPLVVVALSTVICAAQSEGAKTLVLEKNEGEARVRRRLGSLPIPTAEFILKVTPQNSGSKHLVLGTEDIPPGGEIPRHKHLEQDEILLVQTGTAHVTLGAKEYDVHAGGTVFFPAQTWVSLKNIGTDSINLVFIFSAPGFEENMRCGSVPAGQSAPPSTPTNSRPALMKVTSSLRRSRPLRRNSFDTHFRGNGDPKIISGLVRCMRQRSGGVKQIRGRKERGLHPAVTPSMLWPI